MGLSRKQIRVLLIVGFIVGALIGPQLTTALSTFLSNSGPVEGSGVYQAPSGPSITVVGDYRIDLSDPPDGDEVTLRTNKGNISFSSNGQANATIRAEHINGTWTNVSDLSVVTTDLTISPEDKQNVTVGGDVDSLAFQKIAVDDGTTDFIYNGSSGTTSLTVPNIEPDEKVMAVDVETNRVLDVSAPDTSDELSLILPNSEHRVELITTQGDPTLTNPGPEGNLRDFPTELSVDVDDPDFPNDNVTVEFYLDGSKVGEKTTTSAGEVNLSIQQPSRGVHDVRAVATDSYSESTEISWSFGVPNTLYVGNVSNTDELVDNQTVTFTFYQRDDNVTTRTATDGSVNLTDLDIQGDIIVTVEAEGTQYEPEYHTRTFIIQDLAEQDTVYLLPTSAQSVYSVYQLADQSGQYDPGESNLIVKRAVNESGSIDWQAVAGGSFGAANEVPVYLEYGTRYRLVVENPITENQRVVGDYVAADQSNPITITIKSIVVEPPEGQVQYGTAWISDSKEDDGQKKLWFSYNDSDENTDELSIVVHERGYPDNVLFEISPDDPGASFTYSQTLSGDELNKTWVVDWEATDSTGNVLQSGEIPVGNQGGLSLPLDGEWLTRFGLIALVIVASLSSERMATIGAMGTVAFAGILMITGIWQIPVVLWFAALIIAVGGHALTKAQRGGIVG